MFFLEKNKDVNIEQRIKYRFIVKTKSFNDSSHNDYENFLKFDYFNDGIKENILKLLDTKEINSENSEEFVMKY